MRYRSRVWTRCVRWPVLQRDTVERTYSHPCLRRRASQVLNEGIAKLKHPGSQETGKALKWIVEA